MIAQYQITPNYPCANCGKAADAHGLISEICPDKDSETFFKAKEYSHNWEPFDHPGTLTTPFDCGICGEPHALKTDLEGRQ